MRHTHRAQHRLRALERRGGAPDHDRQRPVAPHEPDPRSPAHLRTQPARSASARAKRRDATGEIVDISITSSPRAAPASTAPRAKECLLDLRRIRDAENDHLRTGRKRRRICRLGHAVGAQSLQCVAAPMHGRRHFESGSAQRTRHRLAHRSSPIRLSVPFPGKRCGRRCFMQPRSRPTSTMNSHGKRAPAPLDVRTRPANGR